jgi:acyl dehydratase
MSGTHDRQPPAVGDELPELRIDAIDARDIMLMALVLRDPNPIHYDIDAVRSAGLGEVEVNQGGATMAYILNMLSRWTGSRQDLRSIRCRFSANVLAGQSVTARGTVTAVTPDSDPPDGSPGVLVDCDVWVERDDGARAITGSARVRYPVGDGRAAAAV